MLRAAARVASAACLHALAGPGLPQLPCARRLRASHGHFSTLTPISTGTGSLHADTKSTVAIVFSGYGFTQRMA